MSLSAMLFSFLGTIALTALMFFLLRKMAAERENEAKASKSSTQSEVSPATPVASSSADHASSASTIGTDTAGSPILTGLSGHNSTLPEPLQYLALCQQNGQTIHQEFEFSAPSAEETNTTLSAWFGGLKCSSNGYGLTLFGMAGDGALYAMWRHPQLRDAAPPVVYLGSEGEGQAILAASARDFVALLATGEVWMGDAFVEQDEDMFEEEHLESQQAWRAAATSRYRFTNRPAAQIKEEATSNHPDFQEWVTSVLE
jgi:hypothetical protein